MAIQYTNPQEVTGGDLSLPTAVDLSALAYTFVNIDSNGLVVSCTSGQPLGILQNAPVGTASKNAIASVRVLGSSKLKAGGAGWTANVFLKPTTGGVGIPVTTNKDAYGALSVGLASLGDEGLVVLGQGTISL